MEVAASAGVVAAQNKLWIIVFIFCFLGLLIDVLDAASYSLIPQGRVRLTSVEAGSLGSFTLADGHRRDLRRLGPDRFLAG